MSEKKFKFISPGVFTSEIDNSQIPRTPEEIGPVIIGRTAKGPAFKPVKVSSYDEFVQIFGDAQAGNGNGTDDAKIYVYFQNRLYYGFTTESEFDVSNDVTTMAGGTIVRNTITNTKNYSSLTFNCTSSHYV